MAHITVGRVGFCAHDAVNIKIDRSNPLGNPFKIGIDGTRDEVCDKYRDWLPSAYHTDARVRRAIDNIAHHVSAGRSVNLQCWCHPKRCHGSEIIGFIENNCLTRATSLLVFKS